jgi:hypothetical protein
VRSRDGSIPLSLTLPLLQYGPDRLLGLWYLEIAVATPCGSKPPLPPSQPGLSYIGALGFTQSNPLNGQLGWAFGTVPKLMAFTASAPPPPRHKASWTT